jgi:hypothetical protein
MEKTIFDKIRHYNKNATDTSLKSYSSNIVLVAKALGVNKDDITPSVFKNLNTVYKALESQSLNTIKNKLVAVYMYLQACGYNKDVIEQYNDKIYMLLGKVRNQTAKMEWSDKEKDKLITMDDLMLILSRMRDELSKDLDTFKSIEKMMRYLCLKVYASYPMRNDMADMKIYTDSEFNNIKEDNDINYMVINPKNMGCKIILNNFKTKKEGVVSFPIEDDDLVKMILNYYIACKKFYEYNDHQYEHWFLWKRDYIKMSRNVLTKFLISIFENEIGKKISTTMLRKITTSSLIDTAKFKKMAYIQGHSVNTALSSYAKF